MGPFFAWQILCDLLESQILGTNTDNQWACLGPGAQNGLRRIFPLETTKGTLKHTRLLRDICSLNGQKSGFAALGVDFQAFLNKPLSLKNIGKKHAFKKYDQFAPNTSCFCTGSNISSVVQFHEIFVTKIMNKAKIS